MHSSSKYLILCAYFVVFFGGSNWMTAYGNPFKCKLITEKPVVETKTDDPLIFKGFIVIDEKIYGLVTIGGEELEVVSGQKIKGYTILSISKTQLEYRFKDKRYSINDLD